TSGAGGRATPAQGDHSRPQRNLHGNDLSGRRSRSHRQIRRRALPPRHRVVARGHRCAHRRVGRRPQHDRLAEVSGGAARYGACRGEPPGRRAVAAMGLDMFPDASLLSNTVSCVKTPKSIDPAAVVIRMRDQYGILIGTGLDKMRSSTLRIGTMAMTASPHYVLPTLSALELALRDLGYKCEHGAGVAAAQAAFA